MMRRLAAVCAFLSLILYLGSARPAAAAERLHLAPDLVAAITAVCPACAEKGVMACGDAAVETGPRYLSHVLQGDPPRGYLMSWAASDQDLRSIIQRFGGDAALVVIAMRFSAVTLVTLEPEGKVRSLGQGRILAELPEPLRACLADPAKPWGCCAAGCGEEECCEKSLGSPRIDLRWRDAESDETLRFRWSRNGGSTLSRINAAGQRTTYFCLVWGALRLD